MASLSIYVSFEGTLQLGWFVNQQYTLHLEMDPVRAENLFDRMGLSPLGRRAGQTKSYDATLDFSMESFSVETLVFFLLSFFPSIGWLRKRKRRSFCGWQQAHVHLLVWGQLSRLGVWQGVRKGGCQ